MTNTDIELAKTTLEKLEEFDERIDGCYVCPFYDEECSGDPRLKCLIEETCRLFKIMHSEIEVNVCG